MKIIETNYTINVIKIFLLCFSLVWKNKGNIFVEIEKHIIWH